MKEAIAISGLPREDLYITTKYDALGGEDVRTEFNKSLKKVSYRLRSSFSRPRSSLLR